MTVIQKHSRVIFPVLLFALVAVCGVARAETEKVTIDRNEYSKPEVIRNFLKASISPGFGFEIGEDYTPLFNPSHPDFNKLFAPEAFRDAYPWLYPLLYPDGFPRALVINKWTQPIRISMGFPNDLKPYGEAGKEPVMARLITGFRGTVNEQAEQIVRDEAAKAAPELAALTGLSITWVPDEPKYDPKAVSNLRIVMVHDIGLWTTPFSYGALKSIRSGHGERLRGSPDIYVFENTVERHLNTLVAFTPLYAYGVNGYFIPDKDSEIEFALCYIWDGHDEAVLRKLVQECLVRSLGLPGAASLDYKEQSVLSSWHGPLPLSFDQLTKEQKEIANYVVAIPESLKDRFSFAPVIAGRSNSDDYFIRLLYSDFIKPGMTYLDAYESLTQTLSTPAKRQ